MKRVKHTSLTLGPVKLAVLSGSQPIDHLDVGLVSDVLLTQNHLNQEVRPGYRDLAASFCSTYITIFPCYGGAVFSLYGAVLSQD